MLWLITFVVMLLVVAAMAIGVMAGRKPIAGSCGGMGAAGIDSSCSLCGGNPAKCEETRLDNAPQGTNLFKNASGDDAKPF